MCIRDRWGTNPENGKFFVGTKSVFNKKTPKINYSNEDIERNHPDIELSGILHRCFNFLPRTKKIYQGDFIGFGGYRDYRPNAISYTFQRITHGGVVIAPHTEYKGETMKGMNASPLEYIPAGQGADFIKPNAWLGTTGADNDINLLISFARQVAASIDLSLIHI